MNLKWRFGVDSDNEKMGMGWNSKGEFISYAHRCSNCNTQCPLPQTKFCPGCGRPQSPGKMPEPEKRKMTIQCPGCKKEILPLVNFCPYCGRPIVVALKSNDTSDSL